MSSPAISSATLKATSLLSAILKTQQARYWLISAWGVALIPVSGPLVALVWWGSTILWAGWARTQFENWVSRRQGAGFAAFPLVGLLSAIFWAAAPALAWGSGHPFGRPLALLFLAIGYQLTFTQIGREPRKAMVITLPYSVVAVWIGATLWGTPAFPAYLVGMPVLYSGLAFSAYFAWGAHQKVLEHEAEQERLIRELESARNLAEAANQAKSAFMGMISHELRTPMNGVLGAAQLLQQQSLGPQEAELVHVIRDSGDALLCLLNDLLDLSKIEAERMTVEMVEVDLPNLLDRVTRVWRIRADQKELSYAVSVDPSVPTAILSDPTRLAQIIHNLLSNAVKFTAEGEVGVVVRAEPLSDTAVTIRLEVSDTGPGMSSESAARLFQPFTQLDLSTTRKFGGTGLGLSISRALARLLGGDLEVRSAPGEGSVFSLCFPAEIVHREAAEPLVESPETWDACPPRKVLVVEDHPVNRMLLRTFLQGCGHTVVIAEDGALGLAAAQIEAFDLILMDVNMPVMDGLTATRALRSRPGPNRGTPLAVLSASARSEDHQAGLDAGADMYLDKPVDFQALAALLQRIPQDRSPALQVALA